MKVMLFMLNGKTGFKKWVFFTASSSAKLATRLHGELAQTSVRFAKAET
jgi:hypothetical protein